MSGSSARRGYTLVELTAAAFAALMLFGWCAHATYLTQLISSRASDDDDAGARLEAAFTLIGDIVTGAGIAMPAEESDLREAFAGLVLRPSDWGGELSIETATDRSLRRERAMLRLLYAKPTGARTLESARSSATSIPVVLDTYLPGAGFDCLDITSPSDPRPRTASCWVLFSASKPSGMPLYLKSRPTEEGPGRFRTMLRRASRTGEEIFVPKNARVISLRAAAITTLVVSGDADLDMALMIEDCEYGTRSSSAMQPRVYGIVDARFDWDPESALLTVSLLARGSAPASDARGSVAWPDEWLRDLPPQIRQYRLYSASRRYFLKSLASPDH